MMLDQLTLPPLGKLFRSQNRFDLDELPDYMPEVPDLSSKHVLIIHSDRKAIKQLQMWLAQTGAAVDVVSRESHLDRLLPDIVDYHLVLAEYEIEWLPLLEIIRQLRWESRYRDRGLGLISKQDGRLSSHIDGRLIHKLYQPLNQDALYKMCGRVFPAHVYA